MKVIQWIWKVILLVGAVSIVHASAAASLHAWVEERGPFRRPANVERPRVQLVWQRASLSSHDAAGAAGAFCVCALTTVEGMPQASASSSDSTPFPPPTSSTPPPI